MQRVHLLIGAGDRRPKDIVLSRKLGDEVSDRSPRFRRPTTSKAARGETQCEQRLCCLQVLEHRGRTLSELYGVERERIHGVRHLRILARGGRGTNLLCGEYPKRSVDGTRGERENVA